MSKRHTQRRRGSLLLHGVLTGPRAVPRLGLRPESPARGTRNLDTLLDGPRKTLPGTWESALRAEAQRQFESLVAAMLMGVGASVSTMPHCRKQAKLRPWLYTTW